LHDIFEQQFGRPPDVVASAPGRVNIIGEHTDYNGGFMLPIALPHRTDVLLARRGDALVQVRSLELEGSSSLMRYRIGDESRGEGWLDYVQGVTYIARLVELPMSGCDLLISSTVPIGKGLSSSAALQVSLFRALNQAWHFELDDLSIAKLAHRAETEFVGAPVGMMDQIAASLGNETVALLIDARSLAIEPVPLPSQVELAVLDSGIRHDHASGDYRIRRTECEDAAQRLGVAQLRDLDEGDLAQLEQLPPPLARRARHVITENARVLATVRAFREGDAARAGHLVSLSHASLRDDFEVSTREVDLLVELANAEPDVLGARITGGGFGGAIVALCRRPHAAAIASKVAERYRALTQCAGTALLPALART